VGYVLTKKCAGIVGCSCYIVFSSTVALAANGNFFNCASIAFSEGYDVQKQTQRLYHAKELYRPYIDLVTDQQLVQISI
jgi:broad specificity polyphosphatase/5'/3'-nucleotidase SurE